MKVEGWIKIYEWIKGWIPGIPIMKWKDERIRMKGWKDEWKDEWLNEWIPGNPVYERIEGPSPFEIILWYLDFSKIKTI